MKICFSLMFLVLSVCTVTEAQQDLSAGLVLYYSFSGNTNNTSGSGLQGITNGDFQFTTDRFGNPNSAGLFNGKNTNIIIYDNGLLSTPAFSICYYFKTEMDVEQVIIGKIGYQGGEAATYNSGVFHENNKAYFSVLNQMGNCSVQVPSTYNYTVQSSPQIGINEWHCVVNTFENGIERMYIDGVLISESSTPFSNATFCTNTDFIIGSWWLYDPKWFKGAIDDIRYYNRVLNQDEVNALCSTQDETFTINNYAAVLNASATCNNQLQVDNAVAFNAGDTVLLIQMKGAVIDSANTASFGTITDYGNAGNYEFNIIREKSGNTITLLNQLKRSYDFTNGKVQLVRVPFFQNFTIDKTLTALPWDGTKGGVVVINAAGMVTMNSDIDVTGMGFRHGQGLQNSKVTSNATSYFYNAASNNGGEKGEGIYSISEEREYGRGALANGGGGGNAHNAGGGGGGNGGNGGTGGDQYEPLKTISEQIGGKGGKSLTNNITINKLFLGGAGGMGQANDLSEFPAGNGGGIVIIIANSLQSNGFSIRANGENATEAPTPADAKDGMAGGGGGGTISLNIATIHDQTNVEAKGGKGADQISSSYNGRHGGGGGGGGGVITFLQNAIPSQYTTAITGGVNGINNGYGNDPWGSEPGQDGIIIPGFKLVVDDVPFKKNIDSVRFGESNFNCQSVDFNGLGYLQNPPVKTWQWDFGDGSQSDIQNPSHNFSTEGTFNIKLTITDLNGCTDSIMKPIKIFSGKINKSGDTSICENSSVKLFADGGGTYQWSPSTGLDDAGTSTPNATPVSTTKYYVDVIKDASCTVKDSVLITVNKLPVILKSNDTAVCIGSPVPLHVSGGSLYSWFPDNTLDDLSTANPVATPVVPTTYIVNVTSSEGCAKEDSIRVELFPAQKIQPIAQTLICRDASVLLSATGGSNFSWSPASLVDDPDGQSTNTIKLHSNTMFYLDVKDENSCNYKDSIQINIRPEAVFSISGDETICEHSEAIITGAGGDNYKWVPADSVDNPTNNIVHVSPAGTTTYSVIISENTCGKTDTLQSVITVLPGPLLNVSKSNDITCANPFSQLNAGGTGVSYNWSPSTGLNNPNIANPIAEITSNTLYTVTTTGDNGCRNSDTVSVLVFYTGKRFAGLPNAFTPNSDGINDCFGVSSLGPITDLDFRIFNRFGQLIFHTTNPNGCWDGTFKGQPQDTGTYVYIVTGKTMCDDVNLKGIVNLIR